MKHNRVKKKYYESIMDTKWLVNESKLSSQSKILIFWLLDPCSNKTWPPVLGCTDLLFCRTWHISSISGLMIICELYSNISSINTYQKIELDHYPFKRYGPKRDLLFWGAVKIYMPCSEQKFWYSGYEINWPYPRENFLQT